MTAKLLIDIPIMNWAYTVLLEPGREYSFGTGKGNFVALPPGAASERHAVIKWQDGWILEDSGSQDGTLVNSQRVERHRLTDQDVLKIGSCEVVFQNPQAASGESEWSHTSRLAEERQSALQSVVSRAKIAGIQAGELEQAFGGRNVGGAFAPQAFGAPSQARPASAPAAAAVAQADTSGDLVWVAQTLASIMSAVLSHPGGRDETYALLLGQVRDAISADTGFVMIPDNANMRWIIRAWVGDSAAWTQYERNHPLPLTVTNRAYRTMSLVSNALGEAGGAGDDEPINSVSLQQLNVSSYIAVPLTQGNQRRGVLYFDTRNQHGKFRSRDVKLLELVGNFILEIEDQRQ